MSSSNMTSAFDFMSSSTILAPILPSVSELLAQERFTNLIRLCLQQTLKYLKHSHPLSNLLKRLYQYKDEFILIIESIVQWYCLHFHSALANEHFYGLKRTADDRLRSLIFSVFLPYFKLKLNSLYKQMRANDTNRHLTFYLILEILPKLQIFIDVLSWLYRFSYGFGLTKYYSPTLQLANVQLTYAKDPSPTIPLLSNYHRFFSIISQIISNGVYVIQIIDWWNKSKQKSIKNTSNSQLPISTIRKQPSLRNQHQCPLCSQICHIPTVILGSSYVYCHACIDDYVRRFNRCPSSNQPITNEHLIKIY